MYRISYVLDDSFRVIETIDRDKANSEYKELVNNPAVTELEASILTVDIKFNKNGKVYTYFVDANINKYKYIIASNGDTPQIVCCKYRTVEELKSMAKSRGFSFTDYKTLHGVARR